MDGNSAGGQYCRSLPFLPANFITPVEDLEDSLAWIKALEDASLDNGHLSAEVLQRLRNPPQHKFHFDDADEFYSIKQFIATINASQQTYNNVRSNHNERFPDLPMLSLDQIKSKLGEWTGVETIQVDMCANSCIAYTGLFKDLQVCPKCSLVRNKTSTYESKIGMLEIPAQKFMTIPIGPQLQALWRNKRTARSTMYRHERTAKILQDLRSNGNMVDQYEDILHGSEYLKSCMSGQIKAEDTVIMSSMDGAQLYKDKKSDCWILIWIILELSPDLRYKKNHVLPGAIIPGPNNPKHMVSFLFPGFHHLAALQKEGLKIWNSLEDTMYLSRIFYFMSMFAFFLFLLSNM